MNKVIVREYQPADAASLSELFYQTIHNVNVLDYTDEQINVWAPEKTRCVDGWLEKWQKIKPWVAIIDDEPVGFVELEANGHIDCFYVHHQHQGCGVGKALMNRIHERAAMQGITRLFAEVSITARPFFAKHGFAIERVNTVVKDGVSLRNFIMSTSLDEVISEMRLPVIETARLLLRPAQYGDALAINTAINNSLEQLQRWMPWANDPSLETTEHFVAGSVKSWSAEIQRDFPMVVILKAQNKIIGASGFNDCSNPDIPYYELGYWLETKYTGQGLATELAQALTEYAFTSKGAKRVQIRTQKENLKSQAVAHRCGFTLEAELSAAVKDNLSGEICSGTIYVQLSSL